MSENTNTTTTTTTLTLFCPKLSRAVQLVARDDEKIDLGYIARMFGLDPKSVKLNGYFLSRGVDYVACSVTWKSLLSFFRKRGIGGLVVDGKVLKSGYKRPHRSTKPHIEESNSSKKTKVKDPDADRGSRKIFTSNAFSLKRKQEDILSSLKKLKVDESDLATRERTSSESLFRTGMPCSFLGVNMKRMREDEMVPPTSCKKIRQCKDLCC
ncbi:hypothetical protein CTI12_AA408840 [Artemisia annua]|uniref:Uncharacterized protein n=1 Tax=Artemisia annua TaxID=35608 RepID=A0A2U1M8A9_ARTAN|nr:hypothetical protein CTI12_AA408840 [Artemisia annua]